MTAPPASPLSPARPRAEFWGHVAVGAMACALTVSIAGSLAYLGIRYYRDRGDRIRIAQFVGSLENRSPEELDYTLQQLGRRPGVARRVLPAIVAAAHSSGSEHRQLAAIHLCRAFVDDPAVEDILFRLRLSRAEVVAATAVDALRALQPPPRAAERLARCFDVQTPAVVDVICCGLVELGDDGARALRDALPKFDLPRRQWLAGLVADRRPPNAPELLSPLLHDADPAVRARAVVAAAALGGAEMLNEVAARLDDADPSVRHAAAGCIGRLTGEGFSADDAGVHQARQWRSRRGAAAAG